MEVEQTSYCTLQDKNSSSKYLCYTRRKNGTFRICLTDAVDVWSREYSEDTLTHFRQMFALKSTEDYTLKLRSASGSGHVSVVVHDTSLDLHVGSSPQEHPVNLSRLEAVQATAELRELLFRMAESLTQPDSGSLSSPVKTHQWQPAEFEPRSQQNYSPSVKTKKRLPGASLINPGTKRKLQATGVAFDDVDEC